MEKKKRQQHQQESEKKQNSSQGRSGANDYLKYAGMGFQMLAIIAICTWVGVKLDSRNASETPIYTAILALAGVIVGIYTVVKDFIRNDDHS